jgi:translation initiation factor IF-1
MPRQLDEAIEATVIAELPQRLYRLHTEDGAQIIAGLSEGAKRIGLRILVGERVLVRRARLDPARGTILGHSVRPLRPDPESTS